MVKSLIAGELGLHHRKLRMLDPSPFLNLLSIGDILSFDLLPQIGRMFRTDEFISKAHRDLIRVTVQHYHVLVDIAMLEMLHSEHLPCR